MFAQDAGCAHSTKPEHVALHLQLHHTLCHARTPLIVAAVTEQCLLIGLASAAGTPRHLGAAAAHIVAQAAAQSSDRVTTRQAGRTAAGMAATAGMWTSRTCPEVAPCARALARQALALTGGTRALRLGVGAGMWGLLAVTDLRHAPAQLALRAGPITSCTQMLWAACMTLLA